MVLLIIGIVGFGIGGPVTFLINDNLLKALIASGKTNIVATLFLVGVGIQVIVSFLNKVASWSNYYGEIKGGDHTEDDYKNTCRYKLMNWVSRQFWIDVVADIVCIIAFGRVIWIIIAEVFPKI